MIPFSAVKGDGVEEIREIIDEIATDALANDELEEENQQQEDELC